MATAKTIATSAKKPTPTQTARNISVSKQPMQVRRVGSVSAKPHVEESQAEKKARKERIKARRAPRK